MRKLKIAFLLLLTFALLLPGTALAANYSFRLDQQTVHVFWNEDGTMAIDYVFVFTNDPGASPIDFVDVGLPTDDYDLSNTTADVNGQAVNNIEPSPYVHPGIAVGLGGNAIQPGETGEVHVFVPRVERVLFQDDTDPEYVSGLFSPTWFDPSFVHGETDLSVTFHFPPGVQPEEPRWHEAPSGWPAEPETGFDGQDRVVYTWRNQQASGSDQVIFGASFPKKYIPAEAIQQKYEPVQGEPPSGGSGGGMGILLGENLFGLLCCAGFGGIFVLFGLLGASGSQKRKMQYLPPKIAIEGHGIKRGLTAVEAAILLEQPLDKILTMMLFSVIKKNAATVVSREPLKVDVASPLPEGLQQYEQNFLKAMAMEKKSDQRQALQTMMIDLVKAVSEKMKGFSRRETVAYYRDIMERAWTQVEAAGTPEVKSQKFDENLEWTMLDRDYERRTQDVFRTGPVFVPVWWPRYDPTFGGGIPRGTPAPSTTSVPIPSGEGRGGINMPTLPGSTFAASVVTGVQDFAKNVVGNITEFTGGVTNRTNPVPVVSTTTSSHRAGGGCACACACACAGCACACAGGGR